MNQKIDVFLPVAPKDLFRSRLVIKYLTRHVNNINNIHICTPTPVLPIFEKNELEYNVQYHLDSEILPYVVPQKWKFRPNWILQQFLKLFQDVTNTDYYITIDSDVIVTNQLNFFENTNPIWYYGEDQCESQYFNFNKSMFNLPRKASHTYIGDIGFFNKNIVKHLIEYSGLTKEQIIEQSYNIITNTCHLSEFELYGNFIETFYPDLYITKRLKALKNGKFQFNPYETNWNLEETLQLIQKGTIEKYDVVNMHSWCINSHSWLK